MPRQYALVADDGGVSVNLRPAVVLLVGLLAAGCGSTVYAPATTPAATATPTPIESAAAELFFAQFAALAPPFHVQLTSTLTGPPSGTAVEQADVDGRWYEAQLHVELAGVPPQDSDVIYVDGVGYVADAGSGDWQAYPDYETVPPVNPFIDFDAGQWQALGPDAGHAGLERIHSTSWRLPADSPSAGRLSSVDFDVWLDPTGLPVDARLVFALGGTGAGEAASYTADYQFSRIGQPVTIAPPAGPTLSPTPAATASATPTEVPSMSFSLTSSAFAAGGAIPARYTCDGADEALPIAWSGVPAGTVELALIMADTDAHDFIHWVIAGLPASSSAVGGGLALPAGAREGRNDFGHVGYGGPCPPSGTHHYTLTVYALSVPLGLTGVPTAGEVRRGAATVTLAQAQLAGTYSRQH
jgi:Raf kinase inhibitor-like YbhB/YbcL family protein